MFFIVATLILGLLFGYVGWRLIIPLQLSFVWKTFAWSTLIIFYLLTFVPFIIRFYNIKLPFEQLVGWISFSAMGFISLLFVFFIVRDLGWTLSVSVQKIYHFFAATISNTKVSTNTLDPDRRQFLIQAMNLGILGLGVASAGYGFYEARRKSAIVEIDIPLKNLPDKFNGFRIVQFSDLHVGPTIKNGFVQTVVDQIKDLNADLIAFTGDLVDGTVEQLQNDVEPLRQLSAPYGKYFITGNHEYYSGVLPWCEKAKELGFEVLNNTNKQISIDDQNIILAGVTDYSGGNFSKAHRSDPEQALNGYKGNSPKILLAHQPKSIFDAAKAGYDLQLSGHTHGGQMIPWQFLTRLAQPYMNGLYRHENMWIYVNRGTGYWGPPMRIGARSEITVLRLVQES